MTTEKRKKPPKLEKPVKQYPLDQCALYRLRRFKQLAHVLHWDGSRGSLEALPQQRGAYKVWRRKSGRQIEEANPTLRRLQARIATLLRRVQPPAYRQSGVHGRSFLSNAKHHRISMPAVKTDIEHFYPSVSFDHVRLFFKNDMGCAGDIAFLLASICCYPDQRRKGKGHLPTGGVHSEVLAFYCAKPCFDAIAERAQKHGGVMTTYVDDIMYSAPYASASDLRWMKRLFAEHGLRLHGADKSRVFKREEPRTITGVRIQGEQLRAPQSQHLAVRQRFTELHAPSADSQSRAHTARSLIGHLEHIQQIDSRFTPRAKANRTWLGKLAHGGES